MKCPVRATELDPFEIRDDVWEARAQGLGDATSDRLTYAAAHVVMDARYAEVDHGPDCPGSASDIAEHIDWDATLDVRRSLVDQGLGIAEAMDTAQRFEIGWAGAHELIRRTGEAGLDFVAGAGTDHVNTLSGASDVVDAVVQQVQEVHRCGGHAVLLPVPQLIEMGIDEAGFVDVYTNIIDQCDGPLIVHWLGEAFMPALAGYFPGNAFTTIMAHDPETVRGAKLSLLDAERERELRQRLAEHDQIMLTGDDFNFGSLMTDSAIVTKHVPFGDRQVPLGEFSHALLGILAAIGAPANLALRAMADGRDDDAAVILKSCERLGRLIFEPPTPLYKAGIAFLSYVNGTQDVFDLPNHLQRQRDRTWYARVLKSASECGVIEDAESAAERALYVLG